MFALFVLVTFLVQSFGIDTEKRILLNDPGIYESRISHLEFLTQQLQTQLQSVQRQNSGATFVHWGSSSCSNKTAETVYSGFAAGGNFNYVGSGTNYVCLPRDPQFSDGSHAVSASFTNYIYGAEYETNFFGDKSADQDVPCAVCQSTAGTNILMIPGRLTCYQGWTRQYKGFLSSNYYGYKGQSEYVCVEENAEYLLGGEKSTNGALFYPTIFACGTLQCPPYKNDETVTCVVCSK